MTFAKENDDKTKDLIKKLKKKIDNFEKKFEEIQNNLKEKDSQINELKLMFGAFKNTVKKLDKDIGEVEEREMDAAKNNETFLNESISVMETSFKTQEKPMFRCETCYYKTQSNSLTSLSQVSNMSLTSL